MDDYQRLTEEFHDNAGIDHDGTKDDQMLWVSMLTEELGELAEAVNKDRMDEVGEELADVVIVAFGLARILDVDLREEFEAKMEYNMQKTGAKSEGGKVLDDARSG
ncbi:MAG: nucleoside triphosphate pyrophosphohydrolase family protein [Halobacteriota archaeon]